MKPEEGLEIATKNDSRGKSSFPDYFDIIKRIQIPDRCPRGAPENAERAIIFMAGLDAEMKGVVELGQIKGRECVVVLPKKEKKR